jgi:hypothetical protein
VLVEHGRVAFADGVPAHLDVHELAPGGLLVGDLRVGRISCGFDFAVSISASGK